MGKNIRLLAAICIFTSAFNYKTLIPQAYGLAESTGPGGSDAIAVHQLGQTGEDVNVGLMLARNVRTTHEAFTDAKGIHHAFNYDFSGDGIAISSHDTQLAGIISSRGGAAYPNDIGVAPGTDIHCARVSNNSNAIDWTWFRDALDELIVTQNCRVIVTGFELGTISGDGESVWTYLYDYFSYEYGVVFAIPAGNQNTIVTVLGDAYNGITTGGLRLNDPNNQYDYRRVGTISGSGPTQDSPGRKKPDITAPAQSQTVPTSNSNTAWTTVGTESGQTSYSVPHTAGAAALLIGLADNTPEPNDNRSEVIKAAIVNSAMPNVNDKYNINTNPADSNNTWHPQRGYGRLDVLKAYQLLDSNEIEPDVNITQDAGWGFGRLTQGQMDTYTISINKRCRLIATLTWQRRMQWVDQRPWNNQIDPSELNSYLADLDMIVYAPDDANAIFSEDVFGLNPNDNLEKCDLLITEPGDYTIVIDNDSTNGESADYGFAFELHPIMTGDLPTVDYIVDYNDVATLADDWLLEDSQIDWFLSSDGAIDFADFAKVAQQWLQTDPLYYPKP